GVALEKAGYVPQALEAFRQAVTLDPNYFEARDAVHRLEVVGSVTIEMPRSAPPLAAPGLAPAPSPYAAPNGGFGNPQRTGELPAAQGYSAAPGDVAATPGFEPPPRTAPAA